MTAPVDPGLDPATAAVLAAMAADEVTAEIGTPSLYAGRVISSAGAMRQNIVTEAQRIIRGLWAEVNPWNGDEVARFASRAADITVAAQQQVGMVAAESEFNQLAALDLEYREVIQIPSEVRGTRLDPDEGIITPSRARVRTRSDAPARTTPRKRTIVTYTGDDGEKPSKVRVTITGDPAEAYNRPARKFRFLVTEGMDENEAMARALTQLDGVTDTNAMLAARLGEAEALRRAEKAGVPILGQRRVVHPELSKGGTCGLCLVASDREYKIGTLAPLHDHCKCTTSPITETQDPGSILNAIDLERLYDEAGGNGRDVLKRTRYAVDEHGELATVFKPKGGVERTSTTRPTVKRDKKVPVDRLPYFEAPDDEVRRGDTMPRDIATRAASDLAALSNLTGVLAERGVGE